MSFRLAFTSLALAAALAACDPALDQDQDHDHDGIDPATLAIMAPPTELQHFETLEEMTAGSTAVVDGEVLAVAAGRRVGGTREWIEFDEATLLVHAVLAGDLPAETVLLEMEGRDADGRPLVHSIGLEPNRAGDRGIYFLWRKRDPTPEPRYRLITTQGRFLEVGDHALTASRTDDDLTIRLAALGPAGLRAAIAQEARE